MGAIRLTWVIQTYQRSAASSMHCQTGNAGRGSLGRVHAPGLRASPRHSERPRFQVAPGKGRPHRGFGRERWILALAPTLAAAQINFLLAQGVPDVLNVDIAQRLGNRWPVPSCQGFCDVALSAGMRGSPRARDLVETSRFKIR